MVKDMTKGSPMRLIISFTIPMIFGNLFQQLYNMVDTIVVGRFVGVDALAAVGSVGSVFFLVIGFCTGICSGFSIPVAQFFGAGNYANMKKYIANTGYLCGIFAAALLAVTILLTKPLLILMETPSNIIDDAFTYIIIIFIGIPITIFYNMLSCILRALGDTKTPLKYLTISSVLNIIFDLLFVIVFKMGVAGVAVATNISQLISGILCFIFMKKNVDVLCFENEELKFSSQCCKRLIKVGVPMGLQFSITAIGSIILQAAVNTLGSAVVASVTAASKVQLLMIQPLETMGITMATYGGQNLGARQIKRIRQGVRKSLILSMTYSLAACLAAAFLGRYLVYMFVENPGKQLLDNAQKFMTIGGLFYPFLGVLFILRNLLQGLSYSFVSMFAGVTELAARTIVAFCFVKTIGYTAVCFASPVAWIVAAVMLVIVYIIKIKELTIHFSCKETV